MASGHVYAIQDKGAVKIGWSTAPRQRFKQVQTCSAQDVTFIGTARGTRRHEKQIHDLLNPWRLRGEWFVHEGPVKAFTSMLRPVCEKQRSAPDQEEGYCFRPIIRLWPTYGALADDINQEYVNVQMWHHRDSIPAAHFKGVAEAAQRRAQYTSDESKANKFALVTVDRLVSLATKRAA